jgi:hypothetical protein
VKAGRGRVIGYLLRVIGVDKEEAASSVAIHDPRSTIINPFIWFKIENK